jgi:hypothetical protein
LIPGAGICGDRGVVAVPSRYEIAFAPVEPGILEANAGLAR